MGNSGQPILNVGMIGVGAFAARQHLPNIAADPRYKIHTLCDFDADLLAEREEQFHPTRTTTDADALLADPEVDMVFVATRSSAHAGLLVKAIQNGKHVYVEKPMTMSYEETKEVLAASRSSNAIVGVGFNRRFAPSMVEAKRLFQEYREGPANIIYRIVDDHDIRPKYIFDLNDGGGHLLQEGCHIFDLFAWLLDEEPIEIYATGPLETDNIVLLKFADESVATLVCGGRGGLFYPKESLEVFCNRTTMALDHFYELRLDGPRRNLIQRFPLDPNSGRQLAKDTMTDFYEESFRQRPSHDVRDTAEANELYQLKSDHGHIEAIESFADAVAQKATFAPGVVDGARATVCALKAYESIRANRPVTIQPDEYGKES